MKSIRFFGILNQITINSVSPSFKKNAYSRRWASILANISQDNENLVVKYESNVEKFPLVWLRDNCTCENCFHKSSQSRIISWRTFDVNIEAKSVKINYERDIEICWQDDHKSSYSINWLKSRSFLKDDQEKYIERVYAPSKKPWNKDTFGEIMKKYEYKDIMNNDEKLYHWLLHLSVYGVALIRNSPTDEQTCRKLSERIAFIRKTHYGEDFHVVAKEGTSNVAYLSSELQLHTDLPYYNYKPGVILLHCLVQTKTKGGENLLTDALYVAEKLRRENKDAFDILSQTKVNWSDIGQEGNTTFHKLHRDPVISLDENGNIRCIRYSVPQRDSHFTTNIDSVKPWYEALKLFVSELYSSAAEFKTQPGDILAVDNTRLVHGRVSYEDTDEVRRFLVGNYIDWDEIYSKLRVLRKQFEQ